MEKALKILNELKRNGLIEEYAIGGGIATVFYVEPILTYDLDVMFLLKTEEKLISLSPIYDYLKRKGFHAKKEHIVIEGIPVQFIPVYNELIKEAVENAEEIDYRGVKTRVLKPEYLIAVMLQTYRPKDRERIVKLLDEAKLSANLFKKILQDHGLAKKFAHFKKAYYGK